MIEKMMDPNIIDYYIINCAIPSIITITKSILASLLLKQCTIGNSHARKSGMHPIIDNPAQTQAAIARGQTRQAMRPVLSSSVFG